MKEDIVRNPVIRATYTHTREPAAQVHITPITRNHTLRKCITEPRPQHTRKTWNTHEICPDVHTLRALHPTRHQPLLLSANSSLTPNPICWTFPQGHQPAPAPTPSQMSPSFQRQLHFFIFSFPLLSILFQLRLLPGFFWKPHPSLLRICSPNSQRS